MLPRPLAAILLREGKMEAEEGKGRGFGPPPPNLHYGLTSLVLSVNSVPYELVKVTDACL